MKELISEYIWVAIGILAGIAVIVFVPDFVTTVFGFLETMVTQFSTEVTEWVGQIQLPSQLTWDQ